MVKVKVKVPCSLNRSIDAVPTHLPFLGLEPIGDCGCVIIRLSL